MVSISSRLKLKPGRLARPCLRRVSTSWASRTAGAATSHARRGRAASCRANMPPTGQTSTRSSRRGPRPSRSPESASWSCRFPLGVPGASLLASAARGNNRLAVELQFTNKATFEGAVRSDSTGSVRDRKGNRRAAGMAAAGRQHRQSCSDCDQDVRPLGPRTVAEATRLASRLPAEVQECLPGPRQGVELPRRLVRSRAGGMRTASLRAQRSNPADAQAERWRDKGRRRLSGPRRLGGDGPASRAQEASSPPAGSGGAAGLLRRYAPRNDGAGRSHALGCNDGAVPRQ